MSGFNMDDYVPVNERIEAFLAAYPEGSLQSEIVELSDKRVTVRAYAYRTPGDERPGMGHSWLELPGKTTFTRGSELENAETSAWGRAIAALGFEVKRGVASAEEVASKKSDGGIVDEAKPSRRAPSPPPSTEPVSLGMQTMHGLAGLNAKGADGEMRETPEGHVFAFVLALDAEKRIPQVQVRDPLASVLVAALGGSAKKIDGQEVTVTGELFDVPWQKDGKAMRPFKRLVVSRIETPEFTLPAPTEAPTAPLFDTEAELDAAMDRAGAP
jgi:hypothetical protein